MADIPVTDNRIVYQTTGGETDLWVDWPVLRAGDLTIQRTRDGQPSALVLDVDYRIDGLGSVRGVLVALTAPAEAGDSYEITAPRVVSIERTDGSETVFVLARVVGQWTTPTVYQRGDVVLNNGSSYVARSTHSATVDTEPGVGSQQQTVWQLLAAGGTQVRGDHGLQQGLTDDDHPQYLNVARADQRYALSSHAHPNYLTPDQANQRFSPVGHTHGDTGGTGNSGVTDHGALSGLGDDDHPQYLTAGRADARYSARNHDHANAYEPAGAAAQAAAQAASQAVTAHVAADHPHAQYLRSANPVSHVGVNTTANDTNRLAVNSDASLLNHNGAGHQVKVNKATAGATAAVLFQSNWSGRAEFGLAGDDDFHVKVSADGSSWHEAMVIGAGTGQLQLGAPLRLKQYARAQLPSPSAAGSGALAYVWDAPGGAAVVYCDGGRWRRVADSQELG